MSTPTEEGILLTAPPTGGNRAIDSTEQKIMDERAESAKLSVIDAEMYAAMERLVDKGVKVADFVVIVKSEDGGLNITSARGVIGAIGLCAQGDALARKLMLQTP
ncbi:MAG: hypothetical protein ACREVR_10270 [Burkholderiales bacterium]